MHDYIKKIEGSITSTGTLQGYLSKPKIIGSISSRNLQYKSLSYDSLNSIFNIDLANSKKTDLTIKVNQFNIPYIDFNNIKMTASGKITKQKINLHMATDQLDINTTLIGKINHFIWEGNLTKINVKTLNNFLWKLSKPSNIMFSNNAININPITLTSDKSRLLSLQFLWKKNNPWEFSSSLINGNLDILPSNLLHNITINAPIKWILKASGNGGNLKKLAYQANIGSGTFTVIKPVNYSSKITKGLVTARYPNNGLSAAANFILSPKNSIYSDISIPHFDGNIETISSQKMAAQLRLEIHNILFLSAFIPHTTNIKGSATSKLQLTGIIKKPILNGFLNIKNTTADVPVLDLKLNNINLNIKAKNNNISYVGNVDSSNTTLNISGKTQAFQPGWPTLFNLTGNNVLISNTPSYTLYATPKLKATIKGHHVSLTGYSDMPRATIQPKDFRRVVNLPVNTFIIQGNKSKLAKFWLASMNMYLNLGKNVYLNTIGIKGKLSGSLQLIKKPTQPITATGSINFKPGSTYTTRGKVLQITHSGLQFSNSPINNPNIDINATRTLSNVTSSITNSNQNLTVGVKMTKTLKRPKIKLFSVPSGLTSAQILQYLVLGQAASPGENSNLSLLLQAFKSLKLGGKKKTSSVGDVTQQISDQLGISEIGFKSNLSRDALGNPLQQDQNSFVIGKQLTPKIYINYAMDLVRPVKILQLRYILNKNWYLQTEASSLGKGIDIFYTIEQG